MNFSWQREVCGKLERGCHFVSCLECHLTPLSDTPEEFCFKMRVSICHIPATSQPAAGWSPGRVDGGRFQGVEGLTSYVPLPLQVSP